MAVIGIDLGTTNSLASAWKEDGPVIIPNALGELLTPSVVKRAHVYRVCDQAKAALCEEFHVDVKASIGGKALATTVTRDDFLGYCVGLLDRLRAPLERAVRDSGLGREGFDEVIIVGGASRMPMIKNAVGRMFGRIPSANLDPDLVVAMDGKAVWRDTCSVKASESDLLDVPAEDVLDGTGEDFRAAADYATSS